MLKRLSRNLGSPRFNDSTWKAFGDGTAAPTAFFDSVQTIS